jgi:hypothetical protein
VASPLKPVPAAKPARYSYLADSAAAPPTPDALKLPPTPAAPANTPASPGLGQFMAGHALPAVIPAASMEAALALAAAAVSPSQLAHLTSPSPAAPPSSITRRTATPGSVYDSPQLPATEQQDVQDGTQHQTLDLSMGATKTQLDFASTPTADCTAAGVLTPSSEMDAATRRNAGATPFTGKTAYDGDDVVMGDADDGLPKQQGKSYVINLLCATYVFECCCNVCFICYCRWHAAGVLPHASERHACPSQQQQVQAGS